MNRLFPVTIVLNALISAVALAQTQHEFDKTTYDQVAKKTIGQVLGGSANADQLLGNMRQLITLGVAGCREHLEEPETPETEKKVMQAVIDNAQGMQTLTLEEIEAQWHEGGFLKGQGVDIEQFDHFSEVLCHYEAVVHPATCVICLRQYGNASSEDEREELLEQVKGELQEVREHLKHLE